MIAALTAHIWDTSTRRGAGLVLLLAPVGWAQENGRGRILELAWLQCHTRLNADGLEVTIRQVCASGELICGVGRRLGYDRFLIDLNGPIPERAVQLRAAVAQTTRRHDGTILVAHCDSNKNCHPGEVMVSMTPRSSWLRGLSSAMERSSTFLQRGSTPSPPRPSLATLGRIMRQMHAEKAAL